MLDLCRTVNERGSERFGEEWRTVTPTKVERWLQAGLVAQPDRPGQGRGPGRAVAYTPDHADHLVEVAMLVQQTRSLDTTALLLFVRGTLPSAERVKSAYLAALARLEADTRADAERQLRRVGESRRIDGEWSPKELAEWAEPEMARRVRQGPGGGVLLERFNEMGETPRTGIEQISQVIAAGLLGAQIPAAETETFAKALGGESAEGVRTVPFIELRNLRAVVEEAEAEDFIRARDAFPRMRALLDQLTGLPALSGLSRGIEIVQAFEVEGPVTPLDVLLPLVLERLMGVQINVFLDRLEQFLNSAKP